MYNIYPLQTNGKGIVMNKSELTAAFRSIGISQGTELEVHSSLSSFGHVDGGAGTVIAALEECVGESGSIFMPALRLSPELPLTEEDKRLGISVKIKVLPEDRKRSAMGIIADTFRAQPDVVTGGGIMQVSGWGKRAAEAAAGGFDHVLHGGGNGLLLGVDIYKLTAMHYVEYLIPDDIRRLTAPTEKINSIYPPEEWFIEVGRMPVMGWYSIQRQALDSGVIKRFVIGECPVMFFDLWGVVGLYEQALKSDPYSLFGLDKENPCIK